MDRPTQRFKPNARVRLRDGIDPEFYNGFGRAGNEGWIRKRRLDKHGYPQVLIQWDKDHWSYNGQEDGWTWEGHFESVGDETMSQPTPPEENPELEDRVRAISEQFIKSLFGALGETRGESTGETPQKDEGPDPEVWDELAGRAADAVQKSPAYIVVALEHIEGPDGAPPMVTPRVFHAALDPEYALIAQSQLGHVLASMQDDTIGDVLQQLAKDEE